MPDYPHRPSLVKLQSPGRQVRDFDRASRGLVVPMDLSNKANSDAGKPLLIEEVEVAPPKEGDVRIKVL